jgi:uncharacterized protein YbjT (DUF2867 family)
VVDPPRDPVLPLIDEALRAWARLPLMVGPGAVPGMPVDPLDVAARLVRAMEEGPTARVEEFAGPEVLSFAELADQGLSARGLPVRRLVRVPIPGRLGRALRAGAALPRGGELGSTTWRAWLERRYGGSRGRKVRLGEAASDHRS